MNTTQRHRPGKREREQNPPTPRDDVPVKAQTPPKR